MFNFLNLFDNHEVDRWRDDYSLLAAATLNQVAVDLIQTFEDDLKSATWKDALVRPGSFIAGKVTPVVHEVARPVVDNILLRANESLAQIVHHQATWQYQPVTGTEEAHAFGGWEDVAVAAAPLAGGVAVAATLPVIAVTTTTAFFGLVTTTAVSWPVVVGGGAIAGLGIATGVLNATKLRDKTEARLRAHVRNHVVAMLLQGSSKSRSILEQLTEAFEAAATKAKKSC